MQVFLCKTYAFQKNKNQRVKINIAITKGFAKMRIYQAIKDDIYFFTLSDVVNKIIFIGNDYKFKKVMKTEDWRWLLKVLKNKSLITGIAQKAKMHDVRGIASFGSSAEIRASYKYKKARDFLIQLKKIPKL